MNVGSSIDEKELSKLESNDWWNSSGQFKILHEINKIRVDYIIDKIKRCFQDKDGKVSFDKMNILDVGCGGGLASEALAEFGFNITAIDASQENIRTADAHSRHSVKYECNTPEGLLEHADIKQFDAVICLEVLEHVANLDDFIMNLCSLVKSGGALIVSTINRNIKSYLLAIIMAEYVLNWVPKGTHSHDKFIKPSQLHSILKRNNTRINDLQGMIFDISQQKWVLNDDISVNYLLYAIKDKSYSDIRF
ncbi:MAG: bifunctional 2-polyprenyl-6-hydroxyphenol methylase/3-demethylubiquinol 3-O-methyltransferase UbiG [Rickettsiaceae bacterium]